MLKVVKKIICAVLGLAALHASGFSVFGPMETWQIGALDYGDRTFFYGETENFGTKQDFQGSRLNVPIITYAYDPTFLLYFGNQGVAAVDSAFRYLNSLPAASQARLSKFLTQDNQAVNYSATALGLLDLKSIVMSLMIQHMGLCGETHVWDLAARVADTKSGGFDYAVINRNYDPVTYDPSAYVNGVQYGYVIRDNGTVADAIEYPADLSSTAHFTFTAVATIEGSMAGGYYLGITRDDMGGLSFLYRKNRYCYEITDSNSIVVGNISSYLGISPTATNALTNGFAGLLGGAEKITYVRLNYDSLIGTGFVPRAYYYYINVLTNGVVERLKVARTITNADIIFAASDLLSAPTAYPIQVNGITNQFGFNNNGLTGQGGGILPQVIGTQETIVFDNMPPVYYNATPNFLDQPTATTSFMWGSFDGSTNAPVVYPNGTSYKTILAEAVGTTVGIQPTFDPLSILNANGSNNTIVIPEGSSQFTP